MIDDMVSQFLAHLSEDNRGRRDKMTIQRSGWILYWYFRAGFTGSRIAAELEMTTGAVEKRIARLRGMGDCYFNKLPNSGVQKPLIGGNETEEDIGYADAEGTSQRG
jgi:hypothetical protein